MAEVFLASTLGAEGFSRKVAIKRVLPGYSNSKSFAQMFIAEARISAQLVHPNIVSVLDFDRDPDNRLFLVMELVEGKDLHALLKTGMLPFGVVIFVIGEVLRGLGYAHDLPVGNESRGVVHRDISPHNVLLSWAGAVKVSDFGIAKAREASEATASASIKGKPAYMSPEQANSQPLDGRSDLFAVGIMLWEMLVGRRLFAAADTRATLAAVLFGQIPRPRLLRSDIPKDLERVVMTLLARELPTRYATAEHALHALLECVDAPKAGREALIATLGERFAAEAPVRQSLARPRPDERSDERSDEPSNEPTDARSDEPTDAALPGNGMQLVPSPELGPAAALPSLGTVMNAPTGTIGGNPAGAPAGGRSPGAIHVQTGRRRLIMLAAVLTLGSALASFVIVSVMKSRANVSPLPPALTNVVQDAASGGLIDAPPGVDAMMAAAPADAQKDALPPPVVENKYGSLAVTTDPIVTIYIDGKRYGDTPRTIRKLPVGPHTVRLKNVEGHVDLVRPVTIVENKVATIKWQRPHTP